MIVLLAPCFSTVGCSSDESPAAAAPSASKTCDLGLPFLDGSCVSVGVPQDQCGAGFSHDDAYGCIPILPPEPCPDGTKPELGKTDCQPVGIGADKCGTGFLSDARGGCIAQLPAQDCPAGQMAIPGDAACHEPQPCGTGTYGDIPVDATTQYVNSGYSGGASDGSETHPWTTIADGLAHAAAGGIVAVAAGDYPENIVIGDSVRLWGVCPSKVNVDGASSIKPTITVYATATGDPIEIHGLGITGAAHGLSVLGATNVTLSGLWVHDTLGAAPALYTTSQAHPASVTLEDSLFESTAYGGLGIIASTLTVQRSEIRKALPTATAKYAGRGIEVIDGPSQRGVLLLERSWVHDNRQAGVYIGSSDATIRETLISRTQPRSNDGRFGRGIELSDDNGSRATLDMSGSVLEENHQEGLAILGSDAKVTTSVIRTTKPGPTTQLGGRGIEVELVDTEPGLLDLSDSVIEGNSEVGLAVLGSTAIVESSSIRDTAPRQLDQVAGDGVAAQDYQGSRSTITLRRSIIENNHSVGVGVLSSDATLEGCVVRANLPNPAKTSNGRGIEVDNDQNKRSSLVLVGSLIDANRGAGVFAAGSDARVEASLIRNTLAQEDGLFGVGIGARDYQGQRANLTVVASVIENNQSAGVWVAGSSASIETTVVRNTQPSAAKGTFGYGICVQADNDDPTQRGELTLSHSFVAQNSDTGVLVVTSDASVSSTLVQDTHARPTDQTFGDGVCAILSNVTLDQTAFQGNERASVANFGSTVEVHQVAAICSPLLYNLESQSFDAYRGEPIDTVEASFDQHDNVCSECDGKPRQCRTVSDELKAPEPLPALPVGSGGL